MLPIPCPRPLPHAPGVYQFRDEKGEMIYIGKAKDLKKRVTSYFSRSGQNEKTAALVRHIRSIDFILTDSEEEAILLESNLIKQYYPKYNVALRDNAPLTYALVTEERFPRLLVVRKNREGKMVGPKGRAYGPFIGKSAYGVAAALRKTFKIRTCGNPIQKHVCLQYHLGNCDAPCERRIGEEEYRTTVRQAESMLAKPERVDGYVAGLETKMRQAAARQNFEAAIHLRDSIRSLHGLSPHQKMDAVRDRDEDYVAVWAQEGRAQAQVWRMVHGVIRDRLKFEFDYVEEDPVQEFLLRYYEAHVIPRFVFVNKMPGGDGKVEKHLARLRKASVSLYAAPGRGPKAELMQLIEKNILSEKSGGADPALVRLQKELALERIPIVIECFDISNLAGKAVVGSMVQLVNARPKKSNYRKFKIRTVEGQDDFASMKEVVFRRYRRLRDEGEPMPDLVLVDGGMGQLHSARDALSQLDLDLPLFSLAKENEEIYGLDMLHPLRLEKNNEALHVLQRARDEAHRFAIGYNRKLRKREMFGKR